MAKKEPSFRNSFPPASIESWRELAVAGLKGKPFAKLETPTREGVTLAPLYTQADSLGDDSAGFPGHAPFTRASALLGNAATGWDIHQALSEQTIDALISSIETNIKRGVKSVWLCLDQSSFSIQEWIKLLDSIPKDAKGIGLEVGATPLVAAALLSKTKNKNWIGSINADPVGYYASRGSLPRSLASALDEVASMHRWCENNHPKLQTLRVSTLPYHQAGANGVLELAAALCTGVYYLRELTQRGIELDTIIPKMGFRFAIGKNIFMEVAKLRAARLLWARVVQACTSTEHDGMWIHATTSPVTLTKRDPWVNMLRTTASTFAAATGGANQITSAPFDQALREPDDFSQRIASHTQVILEEESHLGAVIDPAGGSWYIESLTKDLAQRAWTEFQRLEASGGIIEALESGTLQQELSAQWAKRRRAVEFRKEPITGVSEFPNLDEKAIPQSTRIHEDIPTGAVAQSAEVFQAIQSGQANAADLFAQGSNLTCSIVEAQASLSVAQEQPSITSLPKRSLAEPFESLREQSDLALSKAGSRPAVFLANLGSIAQHKARATFAKNFFEAGGFQTHSNDGFDTLQALVQAFQKSNASIAVLCSSDAVYAEQAISTTAALNEAGAKAILLAGRLGDNETELKQAGMTAAIYMGCNVYETLADLMEIAGVAS